MGAFDFPPPLRQFRVGFEAKKLFFNAEKVMRAVNKAERDVLGKFGAFVRQRARTRIRSSGKNGKISEPGEAPRSHQSFGPNLRTIFFWYEPLLHSVIVGPVALNHRPDATLRRGIVPEALENGGWLELAQWRARGSLDWIIGRPRSKRRINSGEVIVRYASVYYKRRPFMRPSLDEELENFPDLWSGTVNEAGAA